MPEMKNILDGENGRLDMVEKKFSELEDLVIETIQMKQGGSILKKNRALLSYGTTSKAQYMCNWNL